MITHKTYTIDSNFDNATEAAFPLGEFDSLPREGDILEVDVMVNNRVDRTIKFILLEDAIRDSSRPEWLIRKRPYVNAQVQECVPRNKQIQRMVFRSIEPYYDNNLEKWFDFK